jgi:dephospho-CoA kinase
LAEHCAEAKQKPLPLPQDRNVTLGITGGSGAGKSTLLAELALRGALVLDCDVIYHELLQSEPKLLREIETEFPGTVTSFQGRGVLDRKRLGSIVFADPSRLLKLNEITHRYMDREVTRRLSGASLAAIDAIALIESGLANRCDVVIAVTAPLEARAARIMKREGVTREYALARIAAQKPDDWYAANSDYVIDNSGTEYEFTLKCNALLDGLLN